MKHVLSKFTIAGPGIIEYLKHVNTNSMLYDKIDFDPLFDVPTKKDFPVLLKSRELAELYIKSNNN